MSVLIPSFIIECLQHCINMGHVPRISQGEGGNSHTVWFISFSILKNGNLVEKRIKVTSSYGSFLDYSHDGFEFINFSTAFNAVINL